MWAGGQCRYYTWGSLLVSPGDDLHITTSAWVASKFGVYGTLELSGAQASLDVVAPVAENDGTLIVSSGAQLIIAQGALVNKGTITLECGGVISGPIQGNPPQH